MSDFDAYRAVAIRYWERRRILFNIALIPPTFFAYMITAGLSYAGDPHRTHTGYVMMLLLISAFGANLCFSFVYALEFLFSRASKESTWFQLGRPLTLIAGTIFAMGLAFVGGRNIAFMEYHYQYQGAGHEQNIAEPSRAANGG